MGEILNNMIADDVPDSNGNGTGSDGNATVTANGGYDYATGPLPHGGRAGSVNAATAPVMHLERGNIEFWLQVAQVVVLILILREVMQ